MSQWSIYIPRVISYRSTLDSSFSTRCCFSYLIPDPCPAFARLCRNCGHASKKGEQVSPEHALVIIGTYTQDGRRVLYIVTCSLPVYGSAGSMCLGKDMDVLCMCCKNTQFCAVVCPFCCRQHNLVALEPSAGNGACGRGAVAHHMWWFYAVSLDHVWEGPAGLRA